MKCLNILLILFLFATSQIFAQQKKKEAAPPDPKITSDPFMIKSGSSFAASSSASKKSPSSEFEPNKNSGLRQQISSDVEQAVELIRSHHVNGETSQISRLTKFSIRSMLRVLDPHSNFFDQREFDELLTEQNSEYIGIGISIENFSKDARVETYVTSVFANSPAMQTGIRFGDRIVAVDGEIVSGLDSMDVRDKIRGERNTTVRLQVERAATAKSETIELERVSVPQPSIPDAYLLRKGVGYIDLGSGFNYSTASELRAALRDLRSKGAKSLILDLRDNPGGILEQAVMVAEIFLPAGATIVSQRGRSSFDNRIWKSQNRLPENMPLVVLVNGGSASASEIVAGALQDNDRAILVGEKTFGKGLVQSVLNLPFGNGLTLTTARYFTPTGRSIQRSYSLGNLYDYYKHQPTQQSVGGFLAVKTSSGRTLYGGDGITPDVTVESPIPNPTQNFLLDPIFFFSMEAFAGRVSGFELSEKLLGALGNIPSDNLSVDYDDKLITAFRDYLTKTESFGISEELIEQDGNFIATQIRYQLASAELGRIHANRIRLNNDLQITRAINSIPVAQNLYQNNRPNAKTLRKPRRAKI